MTGNRVERLESRIKELEASVSGLTEELMQTKSRLADLEDESRGEYIEAGVGSTPERESRSTGNEAHNSTENGEEDTKRRQPDDIIVA